jgi:PDZ domain-containing protein
VSHSSAEPPPHPPGRSRRRRVLQTIATVVGTLLVVAAVAAAVIHVPYVIESPGAATPLTSQVVTVSGARTYQHRGQLLFLTVQVTTSDPNLYSYAFASLSSDDAVVGKQDVLGCASYAADARLNTLLMDDSQNAAKEVALRRLGYPVTPTGDQALVLEIECGGPSDHHLQEGDIITAVDGHPVASADDVHQAVVGLAPHAVVHLTVRRGTQTVPVTVHSGRNGTTAFLGIITQTLTMWHFPLDLRINTQNIGGPSAGLAFTLALISALSPGDVTGGRPVAVTGTINPDGTVGQVGGIPQKAITAQRSGAVAMLVPSGQERDARGAAPHLQVIAVKTVDDALAALRRLGGVPVATGTPLASPSAQ